MARFILAGLAFANVAKQSSEPIAEQNECRYWFFFWILILKHLICQLISYFKSVQIHFFYPLNLTVETIHLQVIEINT